jgi:hypothetical protein
MGDKVVNTPPGPSTRNHSSARRKTGKAYTSIVLGEKKILLASAYIII